jgi:hypothetical protein
MRQLFECRFSAPAGEILSFTSPKESIQRKGAPNAACFLRYVVFIGANGLFLIKTPVLGAAYGNGCATWAAYNRYHHIWRITTRPKDKHNGYVVYFAHLIPTTYNF